MKYFKQFFLLFLVLAVSPAFAADPFTISPTDVSVNELLVKLFEPLVKGDLQSSSALGTIIGQFNAVIIIFGGVLLAYTLVAGTMQTAHDGEVLGRKWSSMWLPLRMSLGVSALVPLGSGYCVAQYLVMWMVLQGVGAANLLWSSFATSVQPMAQMALIQNNSLANDVAANTLRQSMCVVVINTEIAKAKAVAEANGQTYEAPYPDVVVRLKRDASIDPATALDPGGTGAGAISNASEQNRLDKEASCGYYELPSTSLDQPKSMISLFGSSDNIVNFSKSMTNIHIQEMENLQNSMNLIAKGIYNERENAGSGYKNDVAAKKYSEAVNSYNTKIAAAVSAATKSIPSDNEVARNATRDGWAMAGSFYLKYIKLQQGFANEIGKYPTATPPNGDIAPVFQNNVANYNDVVEKILSKSQYTDELGIQTEAKNAMNGERDSAFSEETSWAKKMLNKVTPDGIFKKMLDDTFNKHRLFSSSYWFDIDGQKNIVLAIADAGHRLLNTAIGANLGMATLAIVAPGSSMTVLAPIILGIFGALFGISAIMAFVIPLTPFIIWFGVVIGWLVMVIESIIAAPLWVVTHLYPDGDGIVGRAGQGYSLVLALFLRPPLAVLGLLFSMALINPVGLLFVKSYWSVFAISQDGSSGPVIHVISLTIFAAIILSIVNRIFSLIHIIPDQIFKWMGGPSGDLGTYAGDLAKGSTGAAAATGGAVGAMGGQAIQAAQGFKSLQAQKKSGEEERRQRELSERSAMKKAYSEGADSAPNKIQAPEEAGVNAANKEVNGLENRDFESAMDSLATGNDYASKSYQNAMKSGRHEDAGALIKSKMASNAGFSDYEGYKQNLDDKKQASYQSWAETQPKGTVVGSYGLAQQKIAAYEKAAETGDWGSISGVSSQSAPKPSTSGDNNG